MPVTKQLRLTVWKPLVLDRRVARDGAAPEWPLASGRELFVEAYRWQVGLDVWGSAGHEDEPHLREALVARFSPFKPSHERRFDKLKETLELYDGVLARNATTWRECEQVIPAPDEDGEDMQFRADTIRVLRHHLRWVHQTFHTVPLANLTVR